MTKLLPEGVGERKNDLGTSLYCAGISFFSPGPTESPWLDAGFRFLGRRYSEKSALGQDSFFVEMCTAMTWQRLRQSFVFGDFALSVNF